jgi:hypothetical protein
MEDDGFFDRRLGPPILPLLGRGSDVITIAALTRDGPVSSIFQNRTASRFYLKATTVIDTRWPRVLITPRA